MLGELEVLELRGDPAGTEIASIAHDSRTVTPGALFCCVSGGRVDGHDLAADAVAAGARALLCERVLAVDVAQAVVSSTRVAMAPVAAAFFGHPSRRVPVVGVTGTNGKTTTTHFLAAALRAGGRPCEVIGTLTGPRTTPEAIDLQAQLADLARRGVAGAAIEVSSHALVQHRVDATWFAAAVFTNLSPDHLDYHGTMQEYFEAKASLFSPDRAAVAVVNRDDPWGRRLLDTVAIPTRPFSLDDAVDLDVGTTSSTFRWDGQPVRLHLGGAFNVANGLAAATAARELGIDAAAVAEGLSSVTSVPGRFEAVDSGQPFTVLVDYAHTPDSLTQALVAARVAAGGADDRAAGGAVHGHADDPRPGRVLVVFGCGGERDRSKRPAMGEAAARLADVAVLTTDNPRGEDPLAIIAEVAAGAAHDDGLIIEPDRRAAIGLALDRARPGDVVVVAGKGHETTQVFAASEVDFDDRAVVRDELARTWGASRSRSRSR
ncbi:MAG TPA: UDP-N-acetylmuramoyl-L-alanyl-D-glutamate--2,6-diaminopimelate ligase [Acidimicrobiales bacterium]|nr:UDP-N-acetylmuramoyl-L-alanyl-D-glutamate--2,6-diaminopimelate ligase [Acidimicrobiales bacterium]